MSMQPPDAGFSRHQVRSIVFNLLYAIDINDYQLSIPEAIENFNQSFDSTIPPVGIIRDMAEHIVEERTSLDEAIKPLLHNWRLERVGLCTKLILRMAIWELQSTNTPPHVVINEAIELAKCFAEKDAYKFINGVLDEKVKLMQGHVDP